MVLKFESNTITYTVVHISARLFVALQIIENCESELYLWRLTIMVTDWVKNVRLLLLAITQPRTNLREFSNDAECCVIPVQQLTLYLFVCLCRNRIISHGYLPYMDACSESGKIPAFL